MKDGYLFASENNGCVIFKNDMFMVFVFIVNGLFVLNFDGLFVCNVSVKRFRLNDLSFIYLWYCRLGYISEKCMKKFYSDGFLISFDFELYEICEVCLLGISLKFLKSLRNFRMKLKISVVRKLRFYDLIVEASI